MTRRITPFALFLLVCGSFAVADDEKGFQSLVQGEDISQFELVKIGAETISIKNGEVRLSGTPNGYFATKKSYRNYTLAFEWMYERPENLKSDAAFGGNSGLLVHVVKPLKVWPRSIEVQLANQDAGHIFAIDGKFNGKKDALAQKKAIKPVGQWNRMEVVCKDGAISCKINDVLIDQGQGANPSEGRIGWQSEGGVIRFRDLKIKVLD